LVNNNISLHYILGRRNLVDEGCEKVRAVPAQRELRGRDFRCLLLKYGAVLQIWETLLPDPGATHFHMLVTSLYAGYKGKVTI